MPLGPDDTLVGVLPYFHIYGQTVIMNQGLRAGATIVTMPRFEMGAFLDLLERHRVTRAHVAPPVVRDRRVEIRPLGTEVDDGGVVEQVSLPDRTPATGPGQL